MFDVVVLFPQETIEKVEEKKTRINML